MESPNNLIALEWKLDIFASIYSWLSVIINNLVDDLNDEHKQAGGLSSKHFPEHLMV